MNRSDSVLRQALLQTRRTFATPLRAGRRSVALGAVLLLGSTITVLATANTPPTITSLSVSQSAIDEGQSVTLTGTFTDPDAGDSHTARIKWPDGSIERVEITAGTLTFSTSRSFPDNYNTIYHNIPVEIRDHQLPHDANDNADGMGMDLDHVDFIVNNVAPNIANVKVTRGRAPLTNKVTVEGSLTDPGADTFGVKANWDASGVNAILPGQACTMTGKQQFRCEHTYPQPQLGQSKTYPIKLTARDDDGGQDVTTTSVRIP
jgi:hypothetical protein